MIDPRADLFIHLLAREGRGELRKHVFATRAAEPPLRALARQAARAEADTPEQVVVLEDEVAQSARLTVSLSVVRAAAPAGGLSPELAPGRPRSLGPPGNAFLYTVAYRDAAGRPQVAWAAGDSEVASRQEVLKAAARLAIPEEAGVVELESLMERSAVIGVIRLRALEMFPDRLEDAEPGSRLS